MKDDYVSFRLPAELARALARWARARRVPKSAVVREAVARYLASTDTPEGLQRRVTVRDLAGLWATIPHLTPQEAEDFAADLEAARKELPPLRPTWE